MKVKDLKQLIANLDDNLDVVLLPTEGYQYVVELIKVKKFIDSVSIRRKVSKKNEDEYALVDNWMDYKADVITKYERRIKRFKDILNSDTPIIAIYKGRVEDIQQFKDFFKEKYNKTNIVYIIYKYYLKYFNMINDKIVFDDIIINGDDILICNAETGLDNLLRAINMVKERKEVKEMLERNQLNRKINQSKSNRLLFTSF